jgi:hypothetical protein
MGLACRASLEHTPKSGFSPLVTFKRRVRLCVMGGLLKK